MTRRGREIRFLFDFISHNAYLAWTQIHALAERNGAAVKPVPVLFAGLLNANGQLGPAEILPKAWWMAKNVLRKAVRLGVVVKPPRSHPFNPLLPLRIASLPRPAEEQRRIIDALWAAIWTGGADAASSAEVAAALGRVGLDGSALVAEAQTTAAKERLKEQTAAAVSAGVFGVPTMIVDEELFWGFDDFEFLDLYLQGRDPLPREELPSWAMIRPSASRRRPG